MSTRTSLLHQPAPRPPTITPRMNCGVRGDCVLEGCGTFDTGNRSVSPGFRDDTADTILLIKRLLMRQAAPPRAKLESMFLEESTPLRLDFSHHKTKRHHKTKLESPI